MRIQTSALKATVELYPELQDAYDYFNQRLFAGVLRPCLITLQRGKNTKGYFSAARFVRHDGQLTHEIAMNPAYFASESLKDLLSTLAHEQVHLWQQDYGSPGRRGYHNKEWGEMAKAVGLMPSATGEPGGATVGEHMDHYIIEDGPFDRAADVLIERGFRISWLDRFPACVPLGADIPPSYKPPLVPMEMADEDDDDDAQDILAKPRLPKNVDLGTAENVIVWPSDQRSKQTRAKYRCPGCGSQVWGKPGLDMQCNPCDRRFDEV